jgi:hypothetical protein
MVSAKILTQAYTAVVCIAERSLTDFPDVVPPKKYRDIPDGLFSCGLSLDLNRFKNLGNFKGITSFG